MQPKISLLEDIFVIKDMLNKNIYMLGKIFGFAFLNIWL